MTVLEGLTTWWQLDSTSCTPVDDGLCVWQVKTSNGLRLLDLDDAATLPWSWVLRDALETYCWSHGVHLRLELPPAGREGDPSEAKVTAVKGTLEVRRTQADVTVALLEATLTLLASETSCASNRACGTRIVESAVRRMRRIASHCFALNVTWRSSCNPLILSHATRRSHP
jgi:hypothetical protein